METNPPVIGNVTERKLGGITGKGFRPGQSGNPGGKTKALAEIEALARQHAPRAIERLVEWMETDHATASPAACTALLDRGFGKPKQATEVTGKDGAPIQIEDGTPDLVTLFAAARLKLKA